MNMTLRTPRLFFCLEFGKEGCSFYNLELYLEWYYIEPTEEFWEKIGSEDKFFLQSTFRRI